MSKDNLRVFRVNSRKNLYWLQRRGFFCSNTRLQSRLWTKVTVKLPLTTWTCGFPWEGCFVTDLIQD